MSVVLLALVAVLRACALIQAGGPGGEEPRASAADLRTVAERTDYRKTATYDEVGAFIKDLRERSPLVRVSDIGKSGEGRTIPLVLLADPPVATPAEAKASEKLVVLMLGGIHSGECDGKEALLALARDLATERAAVDGKGGASVLSDLILAFVPIYNPDGNERLDPKNRPGQVGPDTMGKRENAAGLDLNRDFVKLEAPETRGLVRFINQWDPSVIIDTHTTNGSFHRYPLTYDTNKNPAGDAELLEYCRGTLLPAIAGRVKEKDGLDTFWYGNFEGDHARWETYPDQLRYGVNYFGARNRIGVLTESYSYATYKERIDAQLAFLRATLGQASAEREKIRKLIAAADSRASGGQVAEGARPGGRGDRGGPPGRRRGEGRDEPPREAAAATPAPEVPVRTKLTAAAEKATILGYVEERKDGRTVPTAEHKDYEAELLVSYAPELSVARPYAYIIPAGSDGSTPDRAVVQTLQRHGIKLDETREDIELDLSVYTVDTLKKAARPFQGHSTVELKATRREASKRVPAGSVLVRTAQPLGNLACCLLEPESADGLATWNFLDAGLEVGKEFQVYRLEKRTPITSIEAAPLPEDREPLKRMTYEAAFESDRPPSLGGSPVGGLSWLDGEHFLQNKEGRLYKVHAATGRMEPAIDPAPIAAALEKLPAINQRTAASIAGRQGQRYDKARTAFVFEQGDDLYYCKVDGSAAARLTSTPEREELWSLSPDGKFVAFVRKNDLWVVEVETQSERALTTGGTDLLRRGKADWVYFEEVFGRNWQTYWWSPDSARIAFMEIDSSPIKTYTLVNDIPEGLVVEPTAYPKSGAPNPTAKLFTVAVGGGEPREVDLSAYAPADTLIVGAGWFPDGGSAYCYVTNRTQTWLDVLSVPADGAQPTKLFRETTGAWVDTPPPLRFLKDGSFLFTSERSGYKHLYRYAKDGKFMNPVTQGEWEARSVADVDGDDAWVYFSGTKDSHIAANTYRVRPDGTGLERLTGGPGTHRASVSPTGKYFIDSWSSFDTPPRVALFSTESRQIVRMLDTNPVRDLDRYILSPLEMVRIPMPDGFVMEGSLLKPPDFDPGKQYPVWFMTYAGPQAPTVSDSWSGRTWDQVVAQMGFIIFRADPRSASGKGAVSAWTAYKQLGVQELKDIEAAITWLGKNPWVDSSRIGMQGHSYGGFMTSYALTHSKLFAAGIAGAPVTDWHDYDSIYTERYMLTPQENAEGYDKTSVVKGARNLHGRLLLLHGMMDDNVHIQNSTRLLRALQAANKQFEVMFYPEARHGIGGRHNQRLIIDFIQRTLGTPAAASEGTRAAG